LEVEFKPFYMNNKTVLNGKCPPGWDLVTDTCYFYVGAPMTFHEAKQFCSVSVLIISSFELIFISRFFSRTMRPFRSYRAIIWLCGNFYANRANGINTAIKFGSSTSIMFHNVRCSLIRPSRSMLANRGIRSFAKLVRVLFVLNF
jgi:hypothetical protein